VNGVQALKGAVDASHQWYQATLDGVTADIANFLPPGKAHPISANIVHTVQDEDYIIAELIGGGLPLWESERWGEKLRITRMWVQDEVVARNFKFDPAAIKDYAEDVYRQTDAFFASLKDEDLDREIDTADGTMPLGQVLAFFLIANNFVHTGEISALKGLQGLKGYPF
jgi:DinB superfamily